ncbi:histone-lysine N-methyltransferase SETD2 [Rhizoctonia solani]|uniref:Histone-lysine N-methyltransferase SETD2 n=1 Tax=Rhizoctonia solani TaxID=456999 RepID=A0A0K6FS52_9AGAM|nr:histone-lysine N-methyltransferase SETD2 [Rhizoctonia solani]
MVQLIGDLPRAEEEATQHYQEIKENWYQYQTLGRSRNAEEGYACDCHYVRGVSPLYLACGEGSHCINRITQVECIEGECPSKSHCQNQRFQRRQYANIHIVKTEKKGLGLRAASSLKKDDFVYEYVGDVVNETVLRKRMREYAEEGIQHFYFMMLQREQYIDATKRGGKGRFANHSCNPNCYVAKWVVGKRIRMGIFAKRDIEENEELTFNYNVDRYGATDTTHKNTQTDVRANEMLGALGATSKSVKGRDAWNMAIEEDPIPLDPSEANYIVYSIRQLTDRTFLLVILRRISVSEADALRELMQLRCFGLLAGLLEDNYTENHIDKDIVELILQSWQSWPLMNRGKIVQSNIEEKLKVIAQGEDETLKELAEQLLTKWSTLEETGYRIPKRKNEDILLEAEDRSKRLTASESPPHENGPEPQPLPTFKATPLLGGGAHRRIGPLPPPPPPDHSSSTPEPNLLRRPTKSELDAIIARASEVVSSPVPSNVALPTPSSEGTPKNGSSSGKNKKDWSKATYEEKEKRMTKLVGEVVVRTLSKWKSDFSHESFKKTAKEITDKITETEMRRHGHSTGKLDKLSDEKTEKVKKFVKLSAAKHISRQKKQHRQGSDSTPNELDVDTALTTPNDGEIKLPLFATSSATPSGSTPDAPASSLAEMQLDQAPSRG